MTGIVSWRYSDSHEWMERLREGLPPLMITCAVNGGIQGKEANGALPETPEEIARQAKEAYDAGAVAVHVHARDPENWANTSGSAEVYREVNALIREQCPELIINNTTGGGPTTSMEERYRCLDALPELASLNLGPDMSRFKIAPRPAPLDHPHEGFLYDDCIPFTYGIIERLASIMLEKGVKPEMEVYHPGQYWVSRFLIGRELVRPPYLFQYVMGYQTSSYPTAEHVCVLLRDLPESSIFFVCGIGPFQLPMTTMATLLGGHVRVGLEDNVYYSRGRKLRGNGEAVERAVRIARELNREIATPEQARAALGLGAPRAYERPAALA
jgi:3-keto-5-aminohexanoate cleavage enzyme